MEKKERFIKLGKERGFIGLPCQGFFEGDMTGIALIFEGPVGDVIARCYWDDGKGNGGCVSIPGDRMILDSLSATRRRIEDRLRKDWRFLQTIANLM